MSNDVIITDLQGGPAAIFKEQNVQTERLSEGIDGVGFSLVGISGKTFYVRHKGERKTLINPPSNPPSEYDGLPAQHFDFVILRKGARKSHTFYKNGYQPGSEDRPDCISTDGIAPDDNAKEKQSDLCDLCPRYEWKQLANGRDGRECQDSMRLAVLPMPKAMQAVLGEPITEPVLFRIPAASLKGFAQLGDQMEKRFGGNSPFCSYVTRVTFKADKKHPEFNYQVVRWLKPEEAQMILTLREDPASYRILGLTPDGLSLVRRNELVRAVPGVDPNVAQKLAAERQARIAQVRQGAVDGAAEAPKVIDAEILPDIVQAARAAVAPQAAPAPVVDAPADIDALINAMRPRPPGA